jgi:hypothetical protein
VKSVRTAWLSCKFAACSDEKAEGLMQESPPPASTDRLFNVITTGAAAKPARINRLRLSDMPLP